MAKRGYFTERKIFAECLARVTDEGGGTYSDVDTAYGDFARLVVGIVAHMEESELTDWYARAGWGGSPNVKQSKKAARAYLEERGRI